MSAEPSAPDSGIVPHLGNVANSELQELVASPELFECWTRYEQSSINEEDSDMEGMASILDIVLEPDEDFDERYSHTDGLGALPKLSKPLTRSAEPPVQGEAKLAGKYEDSIRIGLKVERTRLLETESAEVKWDEDGRGNYGKFFAGWEPLVPYNLPKALNLVQAVIDENQSRWDKAGLKITVLGSGGEVSAIFGIVRSWFTSKDWLSLYRAQARTLFALDGRDVEKTKDAEVLENIEHALFDTTKYSGVTELMTVITYGKGYDGTLSLFRVTLTPEKPGKPSKAAFLEPIGIAKQVPRAILRDLRRINSRIELVQKKGKVRCLHNGGQFQPSPARVSTKSINKKNKKQLKSWEEIGGGWRRALGIAVDKGDDDGLVATIPQMIALLHLKGSALHHLESTPIEEFQSPLISVPYEEDTKKSSPGWSIERGLKILKGPDRDGHDGDTVKVMVMFPQDSLWANEKLLWA